MGYPALSTNNEIVTYNSSSSVSTSGAKTLLASPHLSVNTGDTLFVFVGYADSTTGSNQVSSITDSQNNSYSRVLSGVSANPESEIWMASQTTNALTAGTDTITVNLASSLLMSFIAFVFPGAVTLDKSSNAYTSGGTSLSVSTGTLSYPYELTASYYVWPGAGPTSFGNTGPGSSPTLVLDTHNNTSPYLFGYYAPPSGTTANVAMSGSWTNSIGAELWALSFVVPPPLFNTTPFSSASTNVSYSDTNAEATVYAGSGTWSISSGALPSGLTINSTTGLISGTPTATYGSTFTVECLDGNGLSSTKNGTILINGLSGPGAIGSGSMHLHTPNAGKFQAYDNHGVPLGPPDYSLQAARKRFIDHWRLTTLKRQQR